MELALVFRRLWALKRVLIAAVLLSAAIGCLAVYKPTLSPLGLEQRGVVFASAATELLVDSTRKPLVDAKGDIEPLAIRAQLFADFARSDEMREAIASRAGLRPDQLQMSSGARDATQNQTRTGEARASFLTREGSKYRVLVSARPALPLLDVFASAPTGKEAVRLSNATADALSDYVEDQRRSRPPVNVTAAEQEARREQGLPPLGAPELIRLRQLGQSAGGLVNPGADWQVGALLTLVSFILFLVFVVVIANLRQGAERFVPRASALADPS